MTRRFCSLLPRAGLLLILVGCDILARPTPKAPPTPSLVAAPAPATVPVPTPAAAPAPAEPLPPAPTAAPTPPTNPEGVEPSTPLREAIRTVMQRQRNALKYCYEREHARNPKLAGKVTVQFTIGANGRVKSATATSTLDNATVEKCLVDTIKKVEFPPTEGGDVVINYPFVFNAQ